MEKLIVTSIVLFPFLSRLADSLSDRETNATTRWKSLFYAVTSEACYWNMLAIMFLATLAFCWSGGKAIYDASTPWILK